MCGPLPLTPTASGDLPGLLTPRLTSGLAGKEDQVPVRAVSLWPPPSKDLKAIEVWCRTSLSPGGGWA